MPSNYLPVRSLYLRRFRSLPEARIDFSNPMFLVGKNGAGKSNVLKALDFISECMSLPLGAVFEKHGGINTVRYRSGLKSRPGNFGMRLDIAQANGKKLNGWYAFEIRAKEGYEFEVMQEKCVVATSDSYTFYDRRGNEIKSNVPGIDPVVDSQALALPLVGGAPQFSPMIKAISSIKVFSIEPRAVQELQDPDSGVSLKSDGSNISSVLRVLSKDKSNYERVCALLGSVAPGNATVRPIKHGKKLSVEFRQEWDELSTGSPMEKERHAVKHEAFSMSDGTLRVLGILLAFFQKNRPSLVALEEPEATIHPEALGSIMDLIKAFSRDTQILVTTHSPELLDAKWLEAENLRIVTWSAGKTQVQNLGEGSVSTIKDHLAGVGELFRSNALRPVDLFHEAKITPQLDLFKDNPK